MKEKWAKILQAARDGKLLRYKAPMSIEPYPFSSRSYEVIGESIRFTPAPRSADPFFADEGHAERISF